MAIPESDWPKIRERMENGERQAAIGKTYKLSAASVSQFKKRMVAREGAGAAKAAKADTASKPRLEPATVVETIEPKTDGPVVTTITHSTMLTLASCIVAVTEVEKGLQSRVALEAAANDLLYLAARLRVTAA